MKYLFIVILLSYNFYTQAQEYEGEAFQDTYTDIEDYRSVILETLDDGFWRYRFELDFLFPYYGDEYDHINCFYEGVCFFDGVFGGSLFLSNFGYETDRVRDPNIINSDARFKLLEKDGLKCLVIQLTKLRMISDPSIEEYDSHVDMQYWFYEDGTIEIRYGHSNLEHSPTYVPGEGFYIITGNAGPVHVANQIRLFNPNDLGAFIMYGNESSHEDDAFTTTDSLTSLLWWPPEGWVVRFRPKSVHTEEEGRKTDWRLHARRGEVLLLRDEVAASGTNIRLYNSLGSLVMLDELPTGTSSHILDVSALPMGIYYYEFAGDAGAYESGRLLIEP